MKNNEIIIVGGGIGGLTTGLALAKKGIASTILEQTPELRIAGAGIMYTPNTFKALKYLGLEEAFKNISFFPDNHCYSDGITGKEYLRIPLGRQVVDRFKHPFGNLHRQEILRTYVSLCEQSPLITIVPLSKVVDVGQDSTTVFAKTENGTVYTGAALIGCDGIWSVVRSHIVDKEPPRNLGQIAYRGVVKREVMPQSLNLNDIMHFVLPNAYVIYYPIGIHGDVHISAIFKPKDRIPDYRETKGNPTELFQTYENALPEVREIIKHVDTSLVRLSLDRDPSNVWYSGRMVLLGDSIHPTHPTLASGAGMAIEDAVVLANAIEKHGKDYEKAFYSFQQERYLRTGYVQLVSSMLTELDQASGVAREIRDFQLSRLTPQDHYRFYTYLYEGI